MTRCNLMNSTILCLILKRLDMTKLSSIVLTLTNLIKEQILSSFALQRTIKKFEEGYILYKKASYKYGYHGNSETMTINNNPS